MFADFFYPILSLMEWPFCQYLSKTSSSFVLQTRQRFVFNLLKLVQFVILIEIHFPMLQFCFTPQLHLLYNF